MVARTITAELKGGRALEKNLKAIVAKLGKGAAVRVGFLESATYSSDEYHWTKSQLKAMSPEARAMAGFLEGKPKFNGHVAQVAFWNEFGTKKTPARPFMRRTAALKSPRWGNALGMAIRRHKGDIHAALADVGQGIQGQLRVAIETWDSPPNAKITRELKGFNAPLRNTGFMAKSVDYQVLDELNGP